MDIRDKEYRRIFNLEDYLKGFFLDESAKFIADKVEYEPTLEDVPTPTLNEIIEIISDNYDTSDLHEQIRDEAQELVRLAGELGYRSPKFKEFYGKLIKLHRHIGEIDFAF